MIAIFSLLMVVWLSTLVTKIGAMALTLTGLSQEVAVFQAGSAFSGVGFATNESESIMSHPIRRRIIMIMMLVGNLGIATVAATLIVSFMNTSASDVWWLNILILIAGLAGLWFLASSRWFERRLNKVIAWSLNRWTNLTVKDYSALLHLRSGFVISEKVVSDGNWLVDKTLRETDITREGVLILGIERGSGTYIGTPKADSVIQVNDRLILYGPINVVDELDQRGQGRMGKKAHREAVAKHQEELMEQEVAEETS